MAQVPPALSTDSSFNDGRGRRFSQDAADMAASIGSLGRANVAVAQPKGFLGRLGLPNMSRRVLGLLLLFATVLLWTAMGFLASYMFADRTYTKPFFLLYFNSVFFAATLAPRFTRYMLRRGMRGLRSDLRKMRAEHHARGRVATLPARDEEDSMIGDRLLIENEDVADQVFAKLPQEKLTFHETASLAMTLSFLWLPTNYLASACLEYTSVASATILNSTSAAWTLAFGALGGVEAFTMRKLLGVTMLLGGVGLISTVDLNGTADVDRGSFPDKTATQTAVGDGMSLISAAVYGVFVTVMKRRAGDEDRVDMRLMFGLVGVFNTLSFWPLFFFLEWLNIETFELPPNGNIWTMILLNGLCAVLSDFAWAYSLQFLTPLTVTVGLSLTIPLSLVGQMIQYGQYSTFTYWIGAGIVVVSFVFVNQDPDGEAKAAEEARAAQAVL